MRSLVAEAKHRNRLADLKAELVKLHQAGFGLKRIASKTGVPKTSVQRWLKDAGVYHPPEKSRKPAGEGPTSRYAILQKSQIRREREARTRAMMAVCLREFWRNGTPIESTCRINGWPHHTIWNHILKRPSYVNLRAKMRRNQRWGGEMEKARRQGITSKTYRTETDFQNAIAVLLLQAGTQFKREAKLMGCRTRADFLVGGDLYVECKVSCRAGQVYGSIGQLLHYSKLSKAKPVLLLPDDVTMRADLAEIIAGIPAVILWENQFCGFLKGQPTLPLTSPPLKCRKRFTQLPTSVT